MGPESSAAQRPPGSLRLATPPVPGGVEFSSACAIHTGSATAVVARLDAGLTHTLARYGRGFAL